MRAHQASLPNNESYGEFKIGSWAGRARRCPFSQAGNSKFRVVKHNGAAPIICLLGGWQPIVTKAKAMAGARASTRAKYLRRPQETPGGPQKPPGGPWKVSTKKKKDTRE